MSALHSVEDPTPEKPSASFVSVTPDMAARWLNLNTGNRPFKKTKIAMYARDMSSGAWQITGEAVKFGWDGRLLDGQNRLAAIVQSGATVVTLVVRGLDPSVQLNMDSGAPRSPSDSLGFVGFTNTKDLAPVVSALMGWDTGFYRHAMVQSTPKFTRTELADGVGNYPDLEEIVPWVKRSQRELPLPIGALGACAYKFMEIDADATTDFYDRIQNLRTTGKGDPIRTLLKRVSDERLSKRRLWVATGIYFQVRAWNAFRDGESLGKFQIGSDTSGWAAIPEPK